MTQNLQNSILQLHVMVVYFYILLYVNEYLEVEVVNSAIYLGFYSRLILRQGVIIACDVIHLLPLDLQ